MGYYRVSYDDLESAYTGINKQISSVITRLGTLSNALSAMANSDSMEGRTADAIKKYLKVIDGKILKGMLQLAIAHKNNFSIYKTRYRIIDSNLHFFINTEELMAIRRELKSIGKNMDEYQYPAAKDAIRDVSDLVTVALSYDKTSRTHAITIEKKVADLIEEFENIHSSNDFTSTESLYYDLWGAIRSLQKKGTGTSAFDTVDYKRTETLDDSIAALAAEQQKKSAAIKEAEEAEREYQLELEEEKEAQELEKREKQAKVFKTVVNVAAAVGTAALIVAATATGGLPIIMAVGFGIGIGGTKGMLDSAADEYVEHGANVSEYDIDEIATETSREGIKTGAKAGAKALKAGAVVVGAIEGSLDAIEEQIDEHGYDFRQYEWGEVVTDTGIKIVTEVIKEEISTEADLSWTDEAKTGTLEEMTEAVSDAGEKSIGDHAAEGLAEGIGKAFEEQIDEHGFNINEYDGAEIIKDTIIKGTESAVEGKIGDEIDAKETPIAAGIANVAVKEGEYVVETVADGEQLDAADAIEKGAASIGETAVDANKTENHWWDDKKSAGN